MDKVRDVLSSLGRNKKGPKRKPKPVVFEYGGHYLEYVMISEEFYHLKISP